MPDWCPCAHCNLDDSIEAFPQEESKTSISKYRRMTGRHVHRDGIVADKAAFEAKYEFVRAIGDGGQAGVYEFKRRDPPYDRVAVKEFGCLTSREWRILAAVRHPHICGLVDEARYENPRVHTTKIIVDCMDTSLQAFLHAKQRTVVRNARVNGGEKENKENKERKEREVNSSNTRTTASPLPGQTKRKGDLLLDTATMQQRQREQRVLHASKKGCMGGDEAGGAGGEGGAGSNRAALDVETVREILYALVLALDYLHHKLIVHLDVKLDNILLRLDERDKTSIKRDPATNRLDVKLADFGLAMLLGGDPSSLPPCPSIAPSSPIPSPPSPKRIPGSPPLVPSPDAQRHPRFAAAGTCKYMAPEVECDSRFGVQADIFSLGVVLHVLLTGGRFPKTAFGQPAVLMDGKEGGEGGGKGEGMIPEEEGFRALVESMLHGDPYRRPHTFQILGHPVLRTLRREGDTLLGDLVDEAEKGRRVMLLSIRRGGENGGGEGGQQQQQQQQEEEEDQEQGQEEEEQRCYNNNSSDISPNLHQLPSSVVHQQQQQQRRPIISSALPPSHLRLSQEDRPLDLYIAYMDLAQIDDPKATVVVCGRKADMPHVRQNEISTLGAIMVRERAGSTTELADVLMMVARDGTGEEEMKEEEEEEDCVMEGQEPPSTSRSAPDSASAACSPSVSHTYPSCRLQQLVRRSGQAFEYLRALWVALVEIEEGEQEGSEGTALRRESIWQIYQELRRLAPALASEDGTAIYLPMTGCGRDQRVKGFASAKAQRQAVIQESVGLAQFMAQALPSRKLESIVLYTWEKDSMHVLMDFVRLFKEEFRGMMSARLDDNEYQRYVGVLCQAAAEMASAASPSTSTTAAATPFSSSSSSSCPGNLILAHDPLLHQYITHLSALNTYPAVCKACSCLGEYLVEKYEAKLMQEGLITRAQGALEVLRYNRDKVLFEEERGARREGGDVDEKGGGWVLMVGHYDSLRSLHAVLSLLRALGP